VTDEEPSDPRITPPRILLVTSAGKQEAARGSYCVQFENPKTGEGGGTCADAAPTYPAWTSRVHPGDHADIFVLPGSITEGSFVVRPLGCLDREVETVELETGWDASHWEVDLQPGAYQLDFFARFDDAEGETGDVSGSAGLVVAEAGRPRTVPLDRSLAVCQFPD
jgi:hypothetical protein